MPANRTHRIVLLSPLSADLLLGASRYATTDRRWVFEIVEPTPLGFETVMRSPPDGVIVYGREDDPLEALARLCPVVNHSGNLPRSPVPRVRLDDAATGRMAADHLLSLGFADLACVWFHDVAYALQRRDAFADAVRRANHRVHPYDLGPTTPVGTRHRDPQTDAGLLAWLRDLPRPTAVFAINDIIAWRVASVCFEAGIDVPEQVAILGVDNMPGVCQIATPQLSSIHVGWDRVGYACAQLLDRLMRGEAPPQADLLLPPIRVVERQSTDILAIDDPKLAAALRFIRQMAHEGIDVDEIAQHAGLPRRTLEARFRDVLGRSPLEEVQRVRVALVKELMNDANLTLEQIAERAGFNSVRWLNDVFFKWEGQTPGRFRRKLGPAHMPG